MSRKEYQAKMHWRYALRGREGKSRLLDELCEVCGQDRKHSLNVLGGRPAASRCEVGRKPVYAKEVIAVIKPIWLVCDLCEGKEKTSVNLTRSRPYNKNDNAHIEQKNWTHERKLIG